MHYKKFDGSMRPELNHDKLKELKSKEDSQQSWWIPKSFTKFAKFIKSRIISSDESEFKHLPIVKTYLASYCKFITGEIDWNLTPVEVIDKIVYTIDSLIKCTFHVDSSQRCLLASDVKQVCKIVKKVIPESCSLFCSCPTHFLIYLYYNYS